MKKNNPVVHFEMPYQNAARVMDFYTKAFGWKMQKTGEEFGFYILATTTEVDENQMHKRTGAINGGFNPHKPGDPPEYPSVVIAVDDIAESAKKVNAAGGNTIGEPMQIPGIGLYLSFTDSEGNKLSMLQPTTDTVTPKVRELFNAYEKAFGALDVAKQVPLFAEQFMTAGPQGIIAINKDQFVQMAAKAAESYKSLGNFEAKIISIHEIPISGEYSMIPVRWQMSFGKNEVRSVEVDVTYLVQNPATEPKIIMFITHKDEQKAMKELGLV